MGHLLKLNVDNFRFLTPSDDYHYEPSVGPPSYIVHETYCKTTVLLKMHAVNMKFLKHGLLENGAVTWKYLFSSKFGTAVLTNT